MKKIVIIGGGAAGLMAACSANYIYRNGGAEITAVKSNIPANNADSSLFKPLSSFE